MAEVYIGLGSNLDNPLAQVMRALDELRRLPSSTLIARSSFYQTEPVGPAGQPHYVNAAAAIRTSLPPLALLDQLHAIERRHRRARSVRWGARTLDLDILLFGNLTLDHPRLTIPHPLMHKRNFVLIPLLEISPDLSMPRRGRIHRLAARLGRSERTGIRIIELDPTESR